MRTRTTRVNPDRPAVTVASASCRGQAPALNPAQPWQVARRAMAERDTP